jgi:hypothetical protein
MYFMRPDIPYCPDKSLRAQLIIAAKAAVDTILKPPRQTHPGSVPTGK